MRSKIAQHILDKIPKHVEVFTDKYVDLVVKINRIIKNQRINQDDISINSAIYKWMSGTFDFKLESIVQLETELGEELIKIV